MVNREEIVAKVNDVFIESFEVEESRLTPEMQIFEDLGLDSLDIVDLVVALQKKFQVQIRDDERVRKIRKLGDIYDFIVLLKSEGYGSEA
jgi:acyl carrier protein